MSLDIRKGREVEIRTSVKSPKSASLSDMDQRLSISEILLICPPTQGYNTYVVRLTSKVWSEVCVN